MSLNMLYVALVIFMACYLYVSNFCIFSERIGNKTKVGYLQSVLEQEMEWFDSSNPMELSAKLSKEIVNI